MADVDVYAAGLLTCSVCAPADMTIEEVVAEVNAINPTGISSQWQHSEEPTFKTGQPNPTVCEQDPDCRHYLMVC